MTGRHGAIIGATASGKSAVGLAIAVADPSFEIVTVDSMQVYRGMDIGTAKPSHADQAAAPHHLLDVANPWEEYDLATYQASAAAVIADIEARGRRALLVGGTALYLRAIIDGLTLPGQFPEVRAELDAEPDTARMHRRLAELDPVAADRMEPSNRRRIVRALEVTMGSGRPFSAFGPGLDQHPPTAFTVIGLGWDRLRLDQRINARYEEQVAQGFVAEVAGLLADRGLSRSAGQALGYKEIAAHLAGEGSLAEAVELAQLRTRRFSRRQDKWFRRDPRIRWVDADRAPADVVDAVTAELQRTPAQD